MSGPTNGWLDWQLGSDPNHYLDQCWLILSWTYKNRKHDQNTAIWVGKGILKCPLQNGVHSCLSLTMNLINEAVCLKLGHGQKIHNIDLSKIYPNFETKIKSKKMVCKGHFQTPFLVHIAVFLLHFHWHLFLFLLHAPLLHILPFDWINIETETQCLPFCRGHFQIPFLVHSSTLAFVPMSPIKDGPVLVQIMAWIWNHLSIKPFLIGSVQSIINTICTHDRPLTHT